MIDRLVGMIDGMLDFILKRIIYRIILFMQKRNYVIPPDTTEDRIVREHTVLNFIALAADIICAILIIIGLEQKLATYAGLMAIAMCILVDQGKIYSDQYKRLAGDENVCLIKGREWKILKKYTPNLGRSVVAVSFIVIFIVLSLISMFQKTLDSPGIVHDIVMLVMLAVMLWIKLKCYFISTFELQDCIIKEREGRVRT